MLAAAAFYEFLVPLSGKHLFAVFVYGRGDHGLDDVGVVADGRGRQRLRRQVLNELLER